MRIALVTRRYPPDCCGVGDYTARLAETLARQGHEVVVFVGERGKDGSSTLEVGSSKGGRPHPSLREGWGTQQPVKKIRVEELKLDGWGDVAGAVETIRAVEPERVQIEYSNYGWSRWGFAFWVNAFVRGLRRAGIPVRIALHEFPLYFRQAPLLAGVSVAQRVHFGLLVLEANEVLTNTRERVRLLRRWLPWRAEAVKYRPNAATIPVARVEEKERAELRAQHGADGNGIVVATFGAFQAAKHYEEVIEAMTRLPATAGPMALWALGDERAAQAKYLATLRQRAEPLDGQAWWPGHLAAEEISACLQATDIFVLPQPDGQLTRSSAFMAAAAHGLAVVAVRNDENQAEFAHGENVWLVEKSKAAEFAEAIRRLAGDAALRERLGTKLRELYEREFAWGKLKS